MRRLVPLAAGAVFGLIAVTPGFRPLLAQAPTPTATPGPTRTIQWHCTAPGGEFSAAIRSMVSVSMHEYIVDGAARVTEVNVDTTGNALARFYYLEPITPQSPTAVGQTALNKIQELAEQAAGRTGQEELWKKVVKSYPTSTHAHTIEFRLNSKADLKKIFDSANTALRENKDTSLTIQ